MFVDLGGGAPPRTIANSLLLLMCSKHLIAGEINMSAVISAREIQNTPPDLGFISFGWSLR